MKTIAKIIWAATIAICGCGDVAPTQPQPVDPCENRQLDATETDVDCGGSCGPCGSNDGCNDNADCLSNECIPTQVHVTTNSIGRCWDETFSGCALVSYDAPASMEMCGSDELVVCQIVANSEMQKRCFLPIKNATPWSANLLCCDPSFL